MAPRVFTHPGGRTKEATSLISQSLAHTALPTTTKLDGCDARALDLYREHGEDLQNLGEDVFEVPSCTGRKVYRVRYGGEVEACECPDFQFGHVCKHLLAVGIAHAARRSGVREVCLPAAVAGDPFKAAGSRKGCPACYSGMVYIGVEEDGEETHQPIPCRRCHPETR